MSETGTAKWYGTSNAAMTTRVPGRPVKFASASERRICYCTHAQAEHDENGCQHCWWCIKFGLAWVR